MNVEIPEGDYDPVLGASYVQISREGLGLSEIAERRAEHSQSRRDDESRTTASDRSSNAADKEKDFFDGIDTSLAGIGHAGKGRRCRLS